MVVGLSSLSWVMTHCDLCDSFGRCSGFVDGVVGMILVLLKGADGFVVSFSQSLYVSVSVIHWVQWVQ